MLAMGVAVSVIVGLNQVHAIHRGLRFVTLQIQSLARKVDPMFRPIAFVGIISIATSVLAQVTISTGGGNQELVRTANGCGVFVVRTPSVPGQKVDLQVEWSGRCVNGVAEGPGQLTEITLVNNQLASRTFYSGHRRAGVGLGYNEMDIQMNMVPLSSQPAAEVEAMNSRRNIGWMYRFDQRGVMVRGGVLRMPAGALTNRQVDLPLADNNFPAPAQIAGGASVAGFSQVVRVTQAPCSLYGDRLPACGGARAGHVYAVMLTPTLGPTATVEQFQRLEPQFFQCPTPSTFDGCHKLFFEKAQPVIDEIMDFIRTTKPLVEAELAAMPQ